MTRALAKPCSLFPSPYSLVPVPCSLFPVPCFKKSTPPPSQTPSNPFIPNTKIPLPILPIISAPKRTLKYIGPNPGHSSSPGRTTLTTDTARQIAPHDSASKTRFSTQFDVFLFSSLFSVLINLPHLLSMKVCAHFFYCYFLFLRFCNNFVPGVWLQPFQPASSREVL
jgi:hypothetical protein